jgi:hypothetical protein
VPWQGHVTTWHLDSKVFLMLHTWDHPSLLCIPYRISVSENHLIFLHVMSTLLYLSIGRKQSTWVGVTYQRGRGSAGRNWGSSQSLNHSHFLTPLLCYLIVTFTFFQRPTKRCVPHIPQHLSNSQCPSGLISLSIFTFVFHPPPHRWVVRGGNEELEFPPLESKLPFNPILLIPILLL